MRTMTIVAALIGISSAGCVLERADPGSASYGIDPAITAEQKADIVLAIQEWESATNGRVHMHELTGGDAHSYEMADIVIQSAARNETCNYEGEHLWNGCTYHDNGLARIKLRLYDTAGDHATSNAPSYWATHIRETSLHELGHAFALKHEPPQYANQAMMAVQHRLLHHLTERDTDRFFDIWGH